MYMRWKDCVKEHEVLWQQEWGTGWFVDVLGYMSHTQDGMMVMEAKATQRHDILA